MNCIHFNGYKPCGFSGNCDSSCEHVSIAEHRIVIVHLGALGAVLRSTSILPAIRRKYKNVHILYDETGNSKREKNVEKITEAFELGKKKGEQLLKDINFIK